MKYRYRGVNKKRNTVSGMIEAQSAEEAKVRLRGMDIRPLEVRKDVFSGELKFNLSLGKAIDLKGLIVFTRQLSSLINSGVTVVMALQILAEQERRPEFKKILIHIKDSIESGGGFAEALEKYSSTFSEFFVRVVEAGEVSGTLDKSLVRIGQQLDKLNNIRRKVIGALIYPAITLVVAAGVITFLLAKVVPEMVKLYGNAKDLPAITQFVIAVSDLVRNYYGSVLTAIVLGVVAAQMAYKVPKVRAVVDPLLLKVPILGLLLLRSGIAIFTRTLATLVSSGVQLLTAFQICERVTSNFHLKTCIRDAALSVTEGQSIAQGLGKRKVFPPMVLHMVSIGEMTGKIDELLLKVAEIYDEEVDDAVSLMTTLLQPALIVVVGGIILVIMLAIYLPIFGMSDKLGT
ncbi:type II secretion system F family protein [bacterium]|nr:type II secretion system F family protein [bacterium]NBX83863.1 type II secretion system F family protein [bacterium]